MRKLTIIRGVPGTGKSTLAEALTAQSPSTIVHLEADMFHSQNGKYEFDFDLIGASHRWCIASTRIFLCRGKDVIVANTFTKLTEMLPYIECALNHGHELEVVTLTKEYGSIHDVPESTMENMRSRFVPHETVLEKINEFKSARSA